MINEVSPPGWGHTKAEKEKTKPEKPKSKIGGTAHAMQKAQKRGDIPKNMNIFALMWSMKNKGDNPHYKPGVKGKLKGKYKGPEGQNEMIDPKKIRNYKNVSNAVVAKADKEAEKVKDKEQKGTLEFPQMPTEESKWSKNFKDQGAKRRGETRRRQEAQRDSPGQRVPPKQKDEGWGAVAKAADSLAAKSKARDDAAKNKKVSSWMKSRKEDMSLAPKGKGRKAAKALYKEEDIDMPSLVSQAIKDAIKEAGGAKELEARNAAKADKKQQGGSLKHKVWPASASMKMPKEEVELAIMSLDHKDDPRKLKITQKGLDALRKDRDRPKVKTQVKITKKGRAAIKDDYVSDFGDKLRQAIEEAKKVNAIDTINKIVKTKTMGKLHGQQVDLFTASAIQSVYKALNKKNQEKMTSVMSKDVHGLLKMADFSMKQMKRR